MRTSGVLPVLASLFVGSMLRAEPLGPELGLPAESAPAPKLASAAATAPSRGKFSDVGGCSITGSATPDLDLSIADAEGRAVARFGGVPVPLTLSDLPERVDARVADVKVKVTTGGNGRLRVSGYVPLRAVPIYLKQDVPFIKGYVTLPRGARIVYAGRTNELARITVTATDGVAESYNVTVSCDQLALEQPKAAKWAPPGHARGYLMKQAVAPLFDKPGNDATAVTTLKRASDVHGILFFGDRREGDFIHVLYRRDVAIEGWMAAKDLEILPRGEIADHSQSKYVPTFDKRLALKADGTLYRIGGDVPLYGKADPKLPAIGVVTRDTEVYVLDVVVGWVKVLPKHLDVVPLPEKNFWVKASDIGI